MDPLSEVLSLLNPRSQSYAGFDAAGDWSFDFPAHQGIKFTAVVKGTCWGKVDSIESHCCFKEGDCFLLNSRQRIVMSSNPDLVAKKPDEILAEAAANGLAIHNGGGDTLLISGRFDFTGAHASILFDVLPPIIRIPHDSDQAGILQWALEQLASELRNNRPGSALISSHLAQLMLVQALRLYIEGEQDIPTGWFLALSDKKISVAMGAIHDNPSKNWSLEELANLSGMSRTVFAQRFKTLVGTTTFDYLIRWKMLIAANMMRSASESISAIAFSVGYESEGAFSTAFKRVMGCSPSQYRREHILR